MTQDQVLRSFAEECLIFSILDIISKNIYLLIFPRIFLEVKNLIIAMIMAIILMCLSKGEREKCAKITLCILFMTIVQLLDI